MITCSDAVKQLWEYLDGAIDDTDRAAIEEHLNVCRRCCGEVEFAEELRTFLAGQGSDEIPDDARVRLNTYLDELQGN
jgi:mycothiol system anti-sigma-R factor